MWIIIYFTLISQDISTAEEELDIEEPMTNEKEAISTLDVDDILYQSLLT